MYSVVPEKVTCASSRLGFLGNVGKLNIPNRLVVGVGGPGMIKVCIGLVRVR